MAFSDWKLEKAVTALVDEAQAMADRLSSAKPHQRDSHAAHAAFWQARFAAEGQDMASLAAWPAADLARFTRAAQTRIAALRKARDYEQADGLALWLHTARAVTEPRIAPPVQEIWGLLLDAGPNAAGMAQDLQAEANLPATALAAPQGFAPDS